MPRTKGGDIRPPGTTQDEQLLESKKWKVRPALGFSGDIDSYRQYITGSRGEFTVAKDQNIRLRSGWFSDRSVCYLASGRPVLIEDTGLHEILPANEGLVTFTDLQGAITGVEKINADYEHRRAVEPRLR